MKNPNKFIRFMTFLILMSMLSLIAGCEKDKSSENSKNKMLFNVFLLLTSNSNECLRRANIDIMAGQTLGPYTEDLCFKISINENTSVNMITSPGTTTGTLHVWSSDTFPYKRTVLYEDDPTLSVTGPGIWYAKANCWKCSSYSISIQ